jgi:hypothetical protein
MEVHTMTAMQTDPVWTLDLPRQLETQVPVAADEARRRDLHTQRSLEEALDERRSQSRPADWAGLRRQPWVERSLDLVAALVAPLVLLPLLALSIVMLRQDNRRKKAEFRVATPHGSEAAGSDSQH